MTDERTIGEGEVDRAAILARRRRFILAALGGLSGVAGCGKAEPPPPSWPSAEPREAVDAHLEQAHPPPPQPAIAEPRRPSTDAELPAILDDPVLASCVDTLLPIDSARDPSEDEKLEAARVLFERGREAEAEGDLACALRLIEAAYYWVPGKHGLAYAVGELAYRVGDCEKARDYLEHYLVYGDHARKSDWEQRSAELLDTPELRACERVVVEDERRWDAYPDTCLSLMPDPKPPPPPPPTPKQRRRSEREARKAQREAERAGRMFAPRKRR